MRFEVPDIHEDIFMLRVAVGGMGCDGIGRPVLWHPVRHRVFRDLLSAVHETEFDMS